MLRADHLVRTIRFGLRAREQSLAWRVAVGEHPDTKPADSVDNDEGARARAIPVRRGEHR